MSALGRFSITANGRKIMMSAVFLSLVVAEVALEHGSAMAAPITLSKVMSDEKLKSQVAEADQAVEADQARLVERQDVAHRCQEVHGVLARAVGNIEQIFELSNEEMSAGNKITVARSVIINNIDVARRARLIESLHVDDAVPVSFSGEDFKLQEIVAGGNMGRQDLAADLETYREQVDYLTDELDRVLMETEYYRDEFSKAINALNEIVKANPEDASSVMKGLSAFRDAKAWQTEFFDEMATTGEDVLVMTGTH
jgi:hypothetical protein